MHPISRPLTRVRARAAQLFDQDKWERHRRVDRYWRHVTPKSIIGSTVFQRILAPVFALSVWAAAVCAYNLALLPALAALAPPLLTRVLPPLALNLAPFSLISACPLRREQALSRRVTLGAAARRAGPMVGLLLVFRTNFSYARFLEGRLLWGAAVRHCRDVARLATAFLPRSEPRDALLGYLQAWVWLLKAHLRAGRTRADPSDPTSYRDDPSKDVRACLPEHLAAPLLAAPNRPFTVLCTLTALLRHVRGAMPDYATRRVEETLCEMGAVAGGCERILSTPMPLSYTRFTGRALVAWLVCLPLALWPLMGWVTPLAIFMLSYVVLGIDEIGVQIEVRLSTRGARAPRRDGGLVTAACAARKPPFRVAWRAAAHYRVMPLAATQEPFCILPLQALCEAVRRDIGIAESAGAAGWAGWPGGLGYEQDKAARTAGAAVADGLDWGTSPPPPAPQAAA